MIVYVVTVGLYEPAIDSIWTSKRKAQNRVAEIEDDEDSGWAEGEVFARWWRVSR